MAELDLAQFSLQRTLLRLALTMRADAMTAGLAQQGRTDERISGFAAEYDR